MPKNNVYYLAQDKDIRNRFHKPGSDNRKIWFFLLLIIIIAFVFFSYLYLLDNRLDIFIARYSEVVDGFFTRGLIVRKETVHYSPERGSVELLQSEGKRVSYGSAVIKIGDSTLYNKEPGLISYAVDGLEEKLVPGNLSNITLDKYNEYSRNYRQLVNGDHVKKGQAIFRIVDNKELFVVIKTSAEEVNRYRYNELIFIKPVEIKMGLIRGRIIDKTISGNKGLIKLKLNIFIKEWLNLRRVNFRFIKNVYRGITIPRSSIFTRTDGQGVLICQADGSYRFKKVVIINGNEELVIVKGLEIGDKVITNPSSIDYGKGVK